MNRTARAWPESRAINLLLALIAAAMVLRGVGTLFPDGDPLRWPAAALMVAYCLLLVLSMWPATHNALYPPLYFSIQSGLILALLLLPPHLDFYAVFFGILSVQVTGVYPQETAFKWVAAFSLLSGVALVWGLGWSEGLPFLILYTALNVAMAYFVVLKNGAESAQRESHDLLEELRQAHRQLQAHAGQVEELAVMKERNRLARDLHDSVTQSLYSLTLFTQAARELAEAGDLERAKGSLARIADTAGQSLKEMRLLVYELRPLALEDENLVEALSRRLDMVERRSGVETRLMVEVDGELRLPASVVDELYHIGQEALNNALKHAHATSVTVRLAQPPGSRRLTFEVTDDGRGFDADGVGSEGGLGLLSIRERVENLGGELELISSPGRGATVRVELELSA